MSDVIVRHHNTNARKFFEVTLCEITGAVRRDAMGKLVKVFVVRQGGGIHSFGERFVVEHDNDEESNKDRS
jgi:hypothetical protein